MASPVDISRHCKCRATVLINRHKLDFMLVITILRVFSIRITKHKRKLVAFLIIIPKLPFLHK